MRFLIAILLSIIPSLLFAQLLYYNLSPQSQGFGSVFTAQEGPSALFSNPGGIASTDDLSIIILSQNIAGFNGLNTSGIGIITPITLGVASISCLYSGDHLLNYKKLTGGWAQRLGIAEIGIQAGWLSNSVRGKNSFHSFTLDFSGIVELSPQLRIGSGIFNLLGSKYSDQDRLPVVARASIDFNPSKPFHIAIEIEKNLLEKPNYKTGISYNLKERLFFSTGIGTYPSSQSFGFGIFLRKLVIQWSIVNHPGLGSQQNLSLLYRKAIVDE